MRPRRRLNWRRGALGLGVWVGYCLILFFLPHRLAWLPAIIWLGVWIVIAGVWLIRSRREIAAGWRAETEEERQRRRSPNQG